VFIRKFDLASTLDRKNIFLIKIMGKTFRIIFMNTWNFQQFITFFYDCCMVKLYSLHIMYLHIYMRNVPFPKCLFFEMDKNSKPSEEWRSCNLIPSFFTLGIWCGRVALYRPGYVDFRPPPKWLPYTSTSLLINWLPTGSTQWLIQSD